MMPKYTTGSLPNLENKKITTTNSSDRDSLQSQQSTTQVQTRNSSSEHFTIAIDWDPTALHLRYQSTLERVSTSLRGCKTRQNS